MLYKLTDQNAQTRGNTPWAVGKTNRVESCASPRLFECEGDVVVRDWGKVGTFELTPVRELPLPDWYTDHDSRERVCVAFAILCAEAVIDVFEEHNPADDRPREAIEAAKSYLANPSDDAAKDAANAAYAAADDTDFSAAGRAYARAAYAAACVADRVAFAAARASYAAYVAARAAVDTARVAADAANAAARAADVTFVALVGHVYVAARTTADAANAAADANADVDFAALADRAVNMAMESRS